LSGDVRDVKFTNDLGDGQDDLGGAGVLDKSRSFLRLYSPFAILNTFVVNTGQWNVHAAFSSSRISA
jgi:hypothetical protein